MPKHSARRSLRWPTILLILFALVLAYFGYRLFFAQPASVFVITDQASLVYGTTTTVSGRLQKDTPAGVLGRYLLVLPDGQVITLNLQGLDALLGARLSVTGIIYPAAADALPQMTVSEFTKP